MLCYYNVHVSKTERQVVTLPRAPLGRIVNDFCFLPDKVFSIGCIQITLCGYIVSLQNKKSYLLGVGELLGYNLTGGICYSDVHPGYYILLLICS